MNSGRNKYLCFDQGDSFSRITYLLPDLIYLSSLVILLIDGKTFINPSGIKTHPKFNPFCSLSKTTLTVYSITSSISQAFPSICSLINTKLGWVDKAHYKAKLEGSLPMILIKYQYLVLEEASVIRLAVNVEYNWELLENPTETSSWLW